MSQRRRVAVELLVLGVLSSGFLVLFPRRPISVDLGLALFAVSLVLLNANYTRTHIWGQWPVEVGRPGWRRCALVTMAHHGARDSRIFLLVGVAIGYQGAVGLEQRRGFSIRTFPPPSCCTCPGPCSSKPSFSSTAWPDAYALPVAPSARSVRVEWADLRCGPHHGSRDRVAGGAGRNPVEFFVSSLPPALAPGRFTGPLSHNVLLLGVWLRSGEPVERLPQKPVELPAYIPER